MLDDVLIDVPFLCAKPPLLPRTGADASICNEGVRSGVVDVGTGNLVQPRRPELLANRHRSHLAPILHRLKVIVLARTWCLFHYHRLKRSIVLIFSSTHEQITGAQVVHWLIIIVIMAV